MSINLHQIAAHPILFLAQDHRSRNMSLIFDPVATDRLHTPHPDRERLLVFKPNCRVTIVTTFMVVPDPVRPQLLLKTSGDITLGFSFGSEFAEAYGPGGSRRGPATQSINRTCEDTKPRSPGPSPSSASSCNRSRPRT